MCKSINYKLYVLPASLSLCWPAHSFSLQTLHSCVSESEVDLANHCFEF